MGTLYVVSTPIGNLKDMSFRAIETLRSVLLIAAEDTRHSGQLLAHFEITTPQISYHAFNEKARIDRLLSALEEGDVALITDAGTPGISDPGVPLIDAALDAGFQVRAVPGPSSLTSAMAISGLIDGPFTFLGFLPRKGQERSVAISRAGASGVGLVLFEAANRLSETLADLAAVLGDRRYAVVREISKIHEETLRGRLGNTQDVARHESARGEVVIVVEGVEPEERRDDLQDVISGMLRSGMRVSDVAREAARITGIARSDAYAIAQQIKAAGSNQPD